MHFPGRRSCDCGWYKTTLCSVQSRQLLSKVEPLAADEWQEIFCVSAGVQCSASEGSSVGGTAAGAAPEKAPACLWE